MEKAIYFCLKSGCTISPYRFSLSTVVRKATAIYFPEN